MPGTPLPVNEKYNLIPEDPWLAWLWVFCPPGFPFVTEVPWIEDRVWKYDS